MKLSDIYIRDPFILPYRGIYYMYGKIELNDTRFVVYTSTDLDNWSEPKVVFDPNDDFWGTKDYWAPEVHEYKGKMYMLASFKAEGKCRGTHVLVADDPMGMFRPISTKPATPIDWECLDGTLYVDKNSIPYIVFCHEWLQIGNGTVCYAQLSEDLSSAVSEPVVMFSAHDFPFVHSLYKERESYVTDGPFLYRSTADELLLIWSSFCKSMGNGYFVNVLKSDNGEITGKWEPQNMLFDEHGGHGMLFRTFEDELKLAIHRPNSPSGAERACLISVYENEWGLRTNGNQDRE